MDYIGTRVGGTAIVADVVSDRGFWLTDGRNRLFTVVQEGSAHKDKLAIKSGQRVKLTGVMMASKDAPDVEGTLDPKAEKLAEQMNKLVVASWKDIEVIPRSGGAVGGGP